MDFLDMLFTMGNTNALVAINQSLGWGYLAIKTIIWLAIIGLPIWWFYNNFIRHPYEVPIDVIGSGNTVTCGRDRARIKKNKDGTMEFKLKKRNFSLPFIPTQMQINPPQGLIFTRGVVKVYQTGTGEYSFAPIELMVTTDEKGKRVVPKAIESKLGMIANAIATSERFSQQPNTMQQWMPVVATALPIVALVVVMLIFSEKISEAAGSLAAASQQMADLGAKLIASKCAPVVEKAAEAVIANPAWPA